MTSWVDIIAAPAGQVDEIALVTVSHLVHSEPVNQETHAEVEGRQVVEIRRVHTGMIVAG